MIEQSPRDTQFAGFADLLFEELSNTEAFEIVDAERFWDGNLKAEVQRVLAQRAYDLVRSSVEYAMLHGVSLPAHIQKERYVDFAMQAIPDMTEWPKEDAK